MKITIAGCGAVGGNLAGMLAREGNEVTAIDSNRAKLDLIEGTLDVAIVEGECSDIKALRAAGISMCDLFVAVTDNDEINIVAAVTAKKLGAARTVARCKKNMYGGANINKEYPALMGIDLVVNPEELTAIEIGKLLRTPGSIVVENFARGAVQLRELFIASGNRTEGKTLKSLSMQRTGLVAAISREGRILIPTGNTEIKAEDKLFVIGKPENLKHLDKIFGKVRMPSRRIIISGGGKVGFAVAQLLEKANLDIKLIERDRTRAEFVSERLKHTLVLVGDGTDINLLREKDIESVAAFAALTGDDENNIVSGLLAKELGVATSVVMVERPEYVSIIERLGIDLAVSPRQLVVNEILRFTRRGSFASVAVLEREKAEMIEVRVEVGSQVVGNKLMDAGFQKGTVVGAIVRGDEVIVPTGSDFILLGDTLVLFTMPENIPHLEKLFKI